MWFIDLLMQIKSHLGVTEEEDDCLVFKASLQQTALDILSPFCYAIVLCQLNLEAVILRSEIEQKVHVRGG